jgi:two-component system, NarL family, sensor kinase
MDNGIFVAVISTTLLILLLVVIAVLVIIVSGRQRMKQEKELIESKLTFERELRQVETEVSEHVMGKFAQELHDNIGQLLTALHIQVENQKIDHPELKESFKPTDIYISEISQQLRMLSRTLNNDYLGHIGLLAAIELEVERMTGLKKFVVHCNALKGPTNLNKNQELMLFRIFQEIVQNALRHSGAANLFIDIKNEGQNFEMSIKDDGKGFNCDEVLNNRLGSGLQNIRKRAKLAGFRAEIISSPDNGCLFTFKLES